jgi:hypothetical protein
MRCPKAGLSLLVAGVLGTVVVLGQAVPPTGAQVAEKATPSAGAQMVEAAQQLLAGLSAELRAKATFAFDDPARTAWHYYPITPEPRKGAVLKAMTPQGKELVKALLRAGTSPAGYETALGVIALEGILRDIENTAWARQYRDSDLYYVSIFGTPARTGKWGWRIEGHHLSLNYVLDNGRVTATTPIAFGANPGEVPSGPYKGLRVLAREEDLARQLYTALDSKARQKATIAETAPFDVLTEVKVQPKRLPVEGLAFAEMGPRPQQLLRQLLEVHARRQPAEVARQLLREVDDAGMERVHFGWAGPPQPGQPHYYRIQGPAFVVEFCNAQNRANHIHCVWRSYAGDFGVPVAK